MKIEKCKCGTPLDHKAIFDALKMKIEKQQDDYLIKLACGCVVIAQVEAYGPEFNDYHHDNPIPTELVERIFYKNIKSAELGSCLINEDGNCWQLEINYNPTIDFYDYDESLLNKLDRLAATEYDLIMEYPESKSQLKLIQDSINNQLAKAG